VPVTKPRENINHGIHVKYVTEKGWILAAHCVTQFLLLLAHYCACSLLVLCHTPGQTAVELARDAQMQQVLCVRPVRQLQKSATRFEGQLLKRSRFLGWKPIWVSFTFCILLPQIPSFFSVCLVAARLYGVYSQPRL
jgi:hypothetical protein